MFKEVERRLEKKKALLIENIIRLSQELLQTFYRRPFRESLSKFLYTIKKYWNTTS